MAIQPQDAIFVGNIDPDTVKKHIDEYVSFYQKGYIVWMIIYAVLGCLAVGLPIVSTQFEKPYSEWLALGGAVATAVFAFLRPNVFATAYDNAAQMADDASSRFILGQISSKDVADILGQANLITRGNYTGLKDGN